MNKPIAWVLLLALGLRVGAALAVQSYLDGIDGRSFVIEGDANGYWALGESLAKGEDYSFASRRVMRMPGFSLLLALSIKLAGPNLLFVRLLLAFVGVVACWMLYWLGRELFDEQTGTLAAALAAVSPVLVGFSVVVLTETLFAACLTASLIVFAKMARRSWRRRRSPEFVPPPDGRPHTQQTSFGLSINQSVLAGLLVGLACYIRPSWLLVAPGFAVLHLLQTKFDRAAILESFLIVASLFVTLAPWAIRNYQVTGHLVFTTMWVGPSLYDGLNEHATGDSDMTFFENENLMASMSEYEMDQEYRRRAWEFAFENPGRAITLGLAKFWRFWKPWPNAVQFQKWYLCLGMTLFFVPMVGFAALALWQNRADLAVVALTAGPIVYFSAIHSLFVGSLRYRLPAEYPFLVLTSAGVISVWRERQSRRADVSPSTA